MSLRGVLGQVLRDASKIFLSELGASVPNLQPDTRGVLQLRAAERSATFVEEHMKGSFICKSRKDLWRLCLGQTSPIHESSLYLEFGVYKGESLAFLAESLNQEVFGFDTGFGLAEDWPAAGLPRNSFRQEAADTAKRLPENAHLIVGLAQETLPGFLASHEGPVALAHFDMDTYQSTLDVLRLLRHRFVPGTVLMFDELIGFPFWEEGEFKALKEFSAEENFQFDFYATTGKAVAIRCT